MWHVAIGNRDLIMYRKAAPQWCARSSSVMQSCPQWRQRLVLREDFANYFNYADYYNYFDFILFIPNCRADKHRQQNTTLLSIACPEFADQCEIVRAIVFWTSASD